MEVKECEKLLLSPKCKVRPTHLILGVLFFPVLASVTCKPTFRWCTLIKIAVIFSTHATVCECEP